MFCVGIDTATIYKKSPSVVRRVISLDESERDDWVGKKVLGDGEK